MFVLSSQNFYQAYKRLEYIKQYTAFRKKQGEKIVLQKAVIKKLNDSLVVKKREKDKLLLAEKEQQKKTERYTAQVEHVGQALANHLPDHG